MSSRSERVRGLMPGHACSSSMNRRGPSERSWTITGVHFVAMISAVAATAQFSCSCTSFIVRLMAKMLLGASGGRYRNGSGTLAAREPRIDGRRALPTFVDRPDDQRLSAPRVSRGEHAVNGRRVTRCVDVAAPVALDAERVERRRLGPEKAHREQDEVRRVPLLRAGHELERRHAAVLLPVDLVHVAAVAGERRRRDREVARASFLQRIRGAQLHRPQRPGRDVVGTRRGRLAEQLDLRDGRGALTVGVADAVGAGVAAADHDHVLPGGRDVPLPPRARVQVVHREVHAVELASGHRQVARDARAGREHERIVALPELADLDVPADVGAVDELDALGDQLLHPALDERLLDLELRDAELHETARSLVSLVHRHRMPGAGELLRTREPGRTGADDGNGAAGARRSRLRHDPALLPRAIDDRDLDLLDRHRVALVDLEDARRLTWGGTEPPGELGEVVRPVQLLDRLAPPVAVDEVVPVGNEVPERAAAVTERDAALHAARALLAQLDERQRADELPQVAGPLARIALGRLAPVDLQERADPPH